MRFLPRFFPLLLALIFLAGCGKKGALYMPDAPAQPVSSQSTQ
jgi:predicted small lipoprotein YifL